ncbi:MAG TPA: hypothetical protein VG651_19655 [Stellaceae bacterium]|nr:hypothetical protein [Stellaceae bacterium]
MTFPVPPLPRAARRRLEPRIRLSRDGCRWIVSPSDRPQCAFDDFADALRHARQVRDAKTATIEVWQGGEYICCLQPETRPSGDQAFPGVASPRFPRLERATNRAARFMLPVVEMVFWLALLVIALAAGFGGRPALH